MHSCFSSGFLSRRLPAGLALLSALMLPAPRPAAAETVKTLVAGAANWSSPSTWLQLRSGTISITANSNIVTGSGTAFQSELTVGDILVNDIDPTQYATISAIYSNTTLAINVYSPFSASGLIYGRQAVPTATSDVQIGNVELSGASSITLDVSAATIKSLTFVQANPGNSLTHATTNSLTVSTNVTLNQPATAGYTNAWNINAGTATVSGSLTIAGTAVSATAIGKATLTTGTLTVGGNLVYNSIAGATAAQAVVDISGGAATLKVGGSILLSGAVTGTLAPGAASTVMFNGTGSQTVETRSAIAYRNLTISKAAGTATWNGSDAITGNFTITQGTFALGSNTLTVPGNWVNNGTLSGTGTVIFNGTGTQTISGAATQSFANITLSKTAGTALTTSGVTTLNAQNLTLTTGNFTAPATLNLSGDLTISSGTFTAGAALNLGGDFINNSAFTAGTGTVTFNGSSAQLLAGTAVTSFKNLTVTNSSAAVSVNTSANISGTLNMNGAATTLVPAAGVVFNNAAAAGILTGTGEVQVTRILATADFVSQYKFTTRTLTNLSVEYSGAGAQAVNNLSYSSLGISGSGTKTVAAALAVPTALSIASGSILNMGAYALSGTLSSLSGTGTLQTQNTTATPLPSGKTWPFAITYSAATGGQSIVAGTYSGGLSSSNTSGTNTVTGAITVNGALGLPGASGYLSMGTYSMGGTLTTVSGAGTLQTYSTAATPLPASGSWSGTVDYLAATGSQTIVTGTYNKLNISNTSGSNASGGALTVTGLLTLGASAALSLGSGTHTMDSMSLQTSSEITVSNAVLQIGGAISGTGDINAVSGSIVMNGTAAQTIPAGIFNSNKVSNLTTSNAAGVTLGGKLKVTDILKASAGTFATGTYLTLVADKTGTALIDGSGAGSITGTVTMQRYLSSGFGYHYLSSPFTAATVAQLSDDVDLSATFPSVYNYDESLTSAGWADYTATGGTLNSMEGYAVQCGASSSAKTIDISGTVNNGVISSGTLYNHNRTYTLGFNLVGNPYPSPIDWSVAAGWTKTNIDNALYYFNPGTTDQYGGAYSTYINGVSSDGVANSVIPSMQGFFVHVSNGTYPVSGSLTVNNAARLTSLTPTFHKGAGGADERSLVRLSAAFTADTAHADYAAVYFEEAAAAGFSPDEDALKLDNTDTRLPNIYLLLPDAQRLSVNGLPPLTDSDLTVPLGISAAGSGWLQIKAALLQKMPAGVHTYLADAQQGQLTSLEGDGVYRAQVEKGISNSRFYLVFSRAAAPPAVPGDAQHLNAYYASNRLHLLMTEAEGTVRITNTLGQVVHSEQVSGKGWHELQPAANSGIQIVTLTTARGQATAKVAAGLQ